MRKYFSKIYVEITNNCNLNCSFCSKDKRKKHEMTLAEFKIVIDKIKDYTNNIYLHVKGEPLLHSKFDEILKICNDNDIKVSLTSNGTLLDKQFPILVKRDIKQINVSLHSENNIDDYFEKVFNIADELSYKTTIIYRLWTLDSIDKISTNIVNKLKKHYHLSTDIVNKLKYDKNIRIIDNIYVDKDYEFDWPNINNIRNNHGTCLGTRTHIAILSDGTIVPCCLDSDGVIKLGNIFTDELKSVINSELFQKIRNGFQNNQVVCDLCKSCTYRERFDKKNISYSRGKPLE